MRIVSSFSQGQHWTPDAGQSSTPVYTQLLADLAGLVVPSATPLTRRRISERLGVRAGSVLGALHHEYLLVPVWA